MSLLPCNFNILIPFPARNNPLMHRIQIPNQRSKRRPDVMRKTRHQLLIRLLRLAVSRNPILIRPDNPINLISNRCSKLMCFCQNTPITISILNILKHLRHFRNLLFCTPTHSSRCQDSRQSHGQKNPRKSFSKQKVTPPY